MMKNVVQEHEKDFLTAFEQKMYAIQKDFKDLKLKANAERQRGKNDARMITLNEERDWFRQEALALDRINKDQKRALHDMKTQLESLKEEKETIYDKLVQVTATAQSLQAENDQQRHDMLTRPLALPPVSSQLSFIDRPAALPLTDNQQAKYDEVLKENEKLRESLANQNEAHRQGKNQLEQQRKICRELQTDAAKFYSQRNDLETLFVQCVNEVKKDIDRRKLNSGVKMPPPSHLLNADVFTAGDKKQVIENLMSNENVLLFLYEKLFPARSDPLVRELQTSESFVLLAQPGKGRQSATTVKSVRDYTQASSQVLSNRSPQAPRGRRYTSYSGQLPPKPSKSQRLVKQSTQISQAESGQKTNPHFAPSHQLNEFSEDQHLTHSHTKLIANNFRRLQQNLQRPLRIQTAQPQRREKTNQRYHAKPSPNCYENAGQSAVARKAFEQQIMRIA